MKGKRDNGNRLTNLLYKQEEVKRKKAKEVLRKQIIGLIESEGVRPFNAARLFGLPPLKAKEFESSYAIEKYFNVSPKDVVEQEGVTIRKMIQRIIRKAGMKDGVPGAQKTIVADKEVIDVNDEWVQLEYLRELMDMTGIRKPDKKKDDEGQSGDKTFDIIINIAGAEQPDRQNGDVSPEIEINEYSE